MALRSRSVERRYQIGRRIAIGERSEIYEAQAPDSDRSLVVKRLMTRGGEDIEPLFLREAAVVACLDHPNVVEAVDVAQLGSLYALVLERVDGLNLTELMACLESSAQPLPLELALGIVGQVARGLSHAHGLILQDGTPLAIVHRDVCPDNILVGADGVPKLGDFGGATLRGHELTAPGVVRSHNRYSAPELTRGEPVDARADVFSLGMVLFEMLGKDSRVPIDPELSQILTDATRVDREQRLRSARDLERRLDRFRAARELRMDAQRMAELIAPFVDTVRSSRPPTARGELEGHVLAFPPDELMPDTGDLRLPQRESVGPPGPASAPAPRRKERLERLRRISRPDLPRLPSLPKPNIEAEPVDWSAWKWPAMMIGISLVLVLVLLLR